MLIKRTLMVAAACTTLIAAQPALAEVKIALDSAPDLESSGTYVWAHTFAEHLNANGMEAVEFERDSLGTEAERLDQVSQGLLEVSMSDLNSAASINSLANGLTLPYFFESWEQVDTALGEGGMLEAINAGTTPEGVRVAAMVHLGGPTGIFTTNTPINSVDDLSAIRMRALSESQIATFEAWGTTGTIVAWGEVPNALQTGVADGYVNPSWVPILFGHTGFIRHFTDAKIVFSFRSAIISEDWYSSLSDEERAIVDEGIELATAANREWLQGQDAVLEELTEAGVAVVELTPEARTEFVDRSLAAWQTIELPEGGLEMWEASVGR
jgi:TRAP-type C4-dicarboxylate transport system substrate-binding protein